MRRALSETVILGIQTNLAHLQAILDTEAFRNGDLTTHFLEEHLPDWQPESVPVPDEGLAAIMLHDLIGGERAGTGTPADRDHGPPTPWESLSSWRHLDTERG
jgi:acetyl/propionyl-CoA carboxylase alpha subunit